MMKTIRRLQTEENEEEGSQGTAPDSMDILLPMFVALGSLVFLLILCICFAWFVKWFISFSYDRRHRRTIVNQTEHSDEENKSEQNVPNNGVITGENGEIRIFGRGSDRDNNNPYEYYVVMRPIGGDESQTKTIGKIKPKSSKFDPSEPRRGPLENNFMELMDNHGRLNASRENHKSSDSKIRKRPESANLENIVNGNFIPIEVENR